MTKAGTKDLSIETLRGIAIILMVAGHVVGRDLNEAMRVADDSPWRFVLWGLQDLRMPLFTVLAGYVYALRPARVWSDYGSLVTGKVTRLLIPLATVGALVFLAKLLNPASTSGIGAGDWWRVYLFGADHLWFLEAIFLIFLVVGALNVCGVLNRFGRWVAVTAAAGALFVVSPVPAEAVFSLDGAIRLLPFFLLGYGLKRFAPRLSTLWLWMLGAAAVAAFIPRMLDLYGVIPLGNSSTQRTLAIVVGVASILLLFHFREKLTNRFLAWLGGYAFGIYLYHYFAVYIVWILVRTLGLDNDFAEFALGMTLALGLPILLQVLTRRSRWLQLVMFGEKLRPRQRVSIPD